jgi:hypothetical protein
MWNVLYILCRGFGALPVAGLGCGALRRKAGRDSIAVLAIRLKCLSLPNVRRSEISSSRFRWAVIDAVLPLRGVH